VIVFSNTTPFIALASTGQLELLPRLFNAIHVADAVIEECAEGGRIAVPDLRSLSWVVPAGEMSGSIQPLLMELDGGEKQTIALAIDRRADLVIMDERLGRRVAEYVGLKVTGTLGVLAKAKSVGLIPSFRAAADALRSEGMYYSAELIARLSDHLGE